MGRCCLLVLHLKAHTGHQQKLHAGRGSNEDPRTAVPAVRADTHLARDAFGWVLGLGLCLLLVDVGFDLPVLGGWGGVTRLNMSLFSRKLEEQMGESFSLWRLPQTHQPPKRAPNDFPTRVGQLRRANLVVCPNPSSHRASFNSMMSIQILTGTPYSTIQGTQVMEIVYTYTYTCTYIICTWVFVVAMFKRPAHVYIYIYIFKKRRKTNKSCKQNM